VSFAAPLVLLALVAIPLLGLLYMRGERNRRAADALAKNHRSAARPAIDFQGSQQRCRGLGGVVVHGFVDGISSGLWPGG